MTIQKKTGKMRAAAFIMAAATLGGVFAGSGLAAPKDVCLTALEKCMVDAVAGGAGGGLGLAITVSSCLAGYDFCRKYIVSTR